MVDVVPRLRRRLQRAVGASLWDAAGGGVVLGGGGSSLQGGPAAPGLALLHSDSFVGSRDVGSFVVRVPENGKVVKVTRVQGARGQVKNRRSRGKVHGLSPGAALRLRRSMLAVNMGKVEGSFLISNTIPLIHGVPEFGWSDVRRFLRLYRQRFERRFPGVAAHWVKELTANGSPHLHLVVAWPRGRMPSLLDFREWNDAAWADVVKSSHPRHRDVGCNVKLLRSWEGAVNYLSCYLSQGSEDDPRTEDSGKMWGIIGKKFLLVDWMPEVELSESEGKFVQRALLRLQRKKREFWCSRRLERDDVDWSKRRHVWKRLRPFRAWNAEDAAMFVDDPWASEVILDLGQQLELLRYYGIPVKRIRPSCCRRQKVQLWSLDSDSGKMELCAQGEEVHSFSSGWHHVASSEVLRLLEYVKKHGVGVGSSRCAGERSEPM